MNNNLQILVTVFCLFAVSAYCLYVVYKEKNKTVVPDDSIPIINTTWMATVAKIVGTASSVAGFLILYFRFAPTYLTDDL